MWGTLDTFTVEIDWNNDGTYDETHSGLSPGVFNYMHQYLDDDPTGSPVDNLPINVRVTDDDTGSVIGSTSVEVTNVAPTLNNLTATRINENGITTFSGTIADVSSLDTFTIEIDWNNDGTIDETHLNVGAGNFSYSHQYPVDNTTGTPVDNMTISVTVTDDDTGTVDGETTAEVSRPTPTLNNLAATPIHENGTTTFSGTIADVGPLDTFTIAIDWNNNDKIDETYMDVPAGNFSYTHQFLDDNPVGTPVDNMLIKVTVTDDYAGSVDGETTVEVTNLAPVLASLTIGNTRANKAVVGQEISVAGLITDIGSLDTHTIIVQWDDYSESNSDLNPGDFTDLDVDGGGVGSFTGVHTYASGGIFDVLVTVIDDDTGESIATTVEVWVSGVRLTDDGELQVIGTAGKDIVNVRQVGGSDGGSDGGKNKGRHGGSDGGPDRVKVTANLNIQGASDGGSDGGKDKGHGHHGHGGHHRHRGHHRHHGRDGGSDGGADTYNFNPDDIQTVRIVLCEGNDIVTLVGGSDAGSDGGKDKGRHRGSDGGSAPGADDAWYARSLIEGDGGRDHLTGGTGADIILGGTGNDRLTGKGADDVLIGGDGKDNLKGGSGDDLLISDIWADEASIAALDALHDVWARPDSYDDRSNALTAVGGLLQSSTLTADAFKDTLNGKKGRDIFFAAAADKVKDRKKHEDLFATQGFVTGKS
ncbi:MAG: hypothetical protein GY903_08815 [Fuerstiella sp.]|nr:hypothetical protein [Fuerstiella sp.]MCP4854582.1 hypothetical protein [Fuerstiella sp.]